MDPGLSSSLRLEETPAPGRGRRALGRIARALDVLVDDGLALDFLVAAILVVLASWLLDIGTSGTFVSVFVVTFVTKHLRGRLEAVARRLEPGEGRARKWSMTGLAALLLLLDEYAASGVRWVLAKLKLATGRARGEINTGALPIQIATAATASFVAFGAVSAGRAVVLDNSASRASVTAFATLSFDDWQRAPSDRTVHFRRPIPDSATKSGGTAHGCHAGVLAAYVRYSDMTEGTIVTMRSFANDRAWAAKSIRWPRAYPADASLWWTFYSTRDGAPIDQPLIARRWRFQLTVGKRKPKETTLTLDNSSC